MNVLLLISIGLILILLVGALIVLLLAGVSNEVGRASAEIVPAAPKRRRVQLRVARYERAEAQVFPDGGRWMRRERLELPLPAGPGHAEVYGEVGGEQG